MKTSGVTWGSLAPSCAVRLGLQSEYEQTLTARNWVLMDDAGWNSTNSAWQMAKDAGILTQVQLCDTPVRLDAEGSVSSHGLSVSKHTSTQQFNRSTIPIDSD